MARKAFLANHKENGRILCLSSGTYPGWVDPDGHLDPRAAKKIWGDWFGKEDEFYRLCAGLVKELNWGDVGNISGSRLYVLEARTLDAYEAMQDQSLPKYLRRGCIGVASENEQSVI